MAPEQIPESPEAAEWKRHQCSYMAWGVLDEERAERALAEYALCERIWLAGNNVQ